MYVMGGYDYFANGDTYQDSIEVLDVSDMSNIQHKSWMNIGNLLTRMLGHRSVIYKDDILVFGGRSRYRYEGTINVINTLTNAVSNGGHLGFTANYMSPIVVYPFMFVFGGNYNMPLNYWKYNILPTISPTSSPITPPTSNPSFVPSINSTVIPSINPTVIPSINPTVIPSVNPTVIPSINPTYVPIYSSESPVSATGSLKNSQLENLNDLFLFVAICFISVTLLTGLTGKIYAKWIHVNDFFTVAAFLKILFHLLDMTSDVFFSAQVYFQTNEKDVQYLVIFMISVAFIIIPIIVTVAQLFQTVRKHWSHDDHARIWLQEKTAFLFIVSILLGSSFAAVELFNSHLFNLMLFSMNLSRKYMLSFRTKRLWSIILVENIPQLLIQTYYKFILDTGDDDNVIVIASIMMSIISIIVTILSVMISKQLLSTQQYTVVNFEISGKCITDKNADNVHYIYKINQIKSAISDILGVEQSVVDVLKPEKVQQGWQLQIYVQRNDANHSAAFHKNLFNSETELATIIQKEWDLNATPTISNIKCRFLQSKKSVKLSMDVSDKENVHTHSELTKLTTDVAVKENAHTHIELT
eukprot:554663_1